MDGQLHSVSATDTFQGFVEAINHHDVHALTSLMSEDHVFVDSLGNRMSGATSMEAGWRAYFAMCPDYMVSVRHVLSSPDMVLATGEAGGTIHGAAWKIPAAWQASIRDGRVVEWRVFADNKPVYEILARRTS